MSVGQLRRLNVDFEPRALAMTDGSRAARRSRLSLVSVVEFAPMGAI